MASAANALPENHEPTLEAIDAPSMTLPPEKTSPSRMVFTWSPRTTCECDQPDLMTGCSSNVHKPVPMPEMYQATRNNL